MSVATLETAIVAEASKIIKRKLKKTDLMEWSTSPIEAPAGEFVVECPKLGIYASFKGKK
jgi:hypothetical protein